MSMLHHVDLANQHGGQDAPPLVDYFRATALSIFCFVCVIFAALMDKKELEICLPRCEEILVKGANVNNTDESGWAALHYASYKGHPDIVEVLVNHNADMNVVTTSGSTAVMLAAEEGHKDVVLILTQKGANLDLVNKSGWAALHYASYKGHTDIVEVLVNHNADMNVVTTEYLIAPSDVGEARSLLVSGKYTFNMKDVARSVLTKEDNKSEDRESTSTQNGDQPSNSDVHSSGQATAQLDYQNDLKSILLNANVCDYSEDGNDTDAQRSIRAMILDKDNTRYKGCAISRHHLEQEWGIVSDKSNDEACDEPDAAIVSSKNEEEEARSLYYLKKSLVNTLTLNQCLSPLV
ncbi:serine/threonine-protein phosphatase 6 regulatory ankyrin repeat subunit C-like [Gigantopelta aegis]|uniref:serine/threonine-protein phosphatase 6 regulatory ankyrin repeat subunit C-like n=1 Tax=Gigantopelta aegis TaxID=1735272 RepID=UPI001B888A47|nr:serine/threonine-protein phosphatase 6 regulatory ankyrin repeat subunit C-like [Gigantopelta aegis]